MEELFNDESKMIHYINQIKKYINDQNPDLLVLLGPTAIGKTKFAIDLAIELNSEIISADSRMVYKEMDIGTSKPTIIERQGIVHHLIDVVNPDENFNVSDFKKLTYEKIEKIKKRGKIPFLVGGTMLYIDAVCDNYDLGLNEPDEEIREALEKKDTEELYEQLLRLDPLYATNINPQNKRHMIRPLEIMIKTGKKISEQKQKNERIYKVCKLGLIMEREKLYKQINDRVLIQLENGLLDETKKLAKKYDYSLPSMTGLGYKQMGYFLKGDMSYDEAVEILQRDTRHFAKRQITWWKRDEEIKWIKQ